MSEPLNLWSDLEGISFHGISESLLVAVQDQKRSEPRGAAAVASVSVELFSQSSLKFLELVLIIFLFHFHSNRINFS